jgi:predicted RNase H-like HicB family nuclease
VGGLHFPYTEDRGSIWTFSTVLIQNPSPEVAIKVAEANRSEGGANDMREYFAVIIQDADMKFDVTFPDLPGCVATAPTFDAARTSARMTLADHLATLERRGDPIPEPSTLETVVGGEDIHCGAAILVQEATMDEVRMSVSPAS